MESDEKDESVVLPFYDAKDCSNDTAFYRALFEINDSKREACIPAIVTEDEDENGYVKVRPIVRYSLNTNKGYKYVNRYDVKVRLFKTCHGGVKVVSPVFVGDTGFLIAGDRDAKTAMAKNAAELESPMSEIPDTPDDDEPNGEEKETQQGAKKPDCFGIGKFRYGFFVPCSFAVNQETSVGAFMNSFDHYLQTVPKTKEGGFDSIVGGLEAFSSTGIPRFGLWYYDEVEEQNETGASPGSGSSGNEETGVQKHGFLLEKKKMGFDVTGYGTLLFEIDNRGKTQLVFRDKSGSGVPVESGVLRQMEVVTDISFNQTGDGLVCRKSTKKIWALDCSDEKPTTTSIPVCSADAVEVVVDCSYGGSFGGTPAFVESKQGIKVLSITGDPSEHVVFQTVEHPND